MDAVQVVSRSISDAKIFDETSALLQQAAEAEVFPGAVLLVGRHGEILYRKAVGVKSLVTVVDEEASPAKRLPSTPSMDVDTVFDVAALTGSVVTSTLLMKLVEINKIKLDERVCRYIQGFGVLGKSAISVGQTLSHISGLPHWYPFFEDLLRENAGARMGILTSRGAREYIVNLINRSELKYTPGTRQVYSDVGYILLGNLIEALTGFSLDRALARYITQPLQMKSTSYIDLSMIKRRGIHPVTDLIAPTEECPWRRRILCGEVHDDNAWAMGGIAGHSGLFSTATDLHIFASEMMRAWRGHSDYLRANTVKQFWSAQPGAPEGSSWRLGWDSPSRENGMSETSLSPNAVGHNGFTGCSLWIEPERGIDIVLMSNRVHPSRNNRKIQAFRPEIHSAVLDALKKL